ncbi:Protocadherin alpha-12, partial [Schistosoma japonicum]
CFFLKTFLRTILDRELQGTYTFYAYVHDGPTQNMQTTNITDNRAESQQTVNNYRSHTASIMVTITIQDENDNDPVFVRPNSTNHMILLNPSAIPGQSLSQLLAIDPDEGLNGQVTYAIKGETAGTLFNVDPRTGLLYLESQIPRQYIINNNKQKSTIIDNQGNDITYPTFLLALNACDQGDDFFSQHFIRSSSNIIDEVKTNEYGQNDLSSNHLHDNSLISRSDDGSISSSSLSSSSSSVNFFSDDSTSSNNQLGRYSLGEIFIIGLSIFFTILIVIILFAVCIVRRRTQQLLQNNERINAIKTT